MFPEYSGAQIKDLPVMGDAAPALPSDAPKTNQDPAVPSLAAKLLAQPPDATRTTGDQVANGNAVDAGARQGSLWSRWRTQLTWTFLVLLLSWASLKVIGEA